MDIAKRTSYIIKLIYRQRLGEDVTSELIKCVCEYYDCMRHYKLSEANLHFLRYIAKEAGIPQYYYMLEQFDKRICVNNVDMGTLSLLIHESTLHTIEDVMLHRYQREVLDQFRTNSSNRFFFYLHQHLLEKRFLFMR